MSVPVTAQTSRPVLNQQEPIELILSIESFSGGINTTGEDQAVKSNEARRNENWEALSLGGMRRIAGVASIASGSINTSASFLDSSSNAFTVTPVGNAAITTAQSVFGGASLVLDGTGDYLTVPDNSAFDLSGGVWTVDSWVRVSDLSSSRTIFSQQTDANNYLHCFINTDGSVETFIYASGSQVVGLVTDPGLVVVNTWTHLAFVENGNDYYLFVNGVGYTTSDTDRPANYTGTFQIGIRDGSTNPYIGWIDEFRVTKGVARWTASFTPSTSEYTSDANTSLLLHFNTPYSGPLDMLVHHTEGTNSALYGIVQGDLVIKNGSYLVEEDDAVFTSGVLSTAISEGDSCWITNDTDGLFVKTIGNAIAATTDQPGENCARIYRHKNRLIAEGSIAEPQRVNISRVGVGEWNQSDTWSLADDASTIDLPDATQGCAPNFPSGDEVTVFTKSLCYSIYNFPNTAFRPFLNGRGCAAPLSIARGDEGVYFVSQLPTLGIFLFDGVNFTELTQFNNKSSTSDGFDIQKVNLSGRIFGRYRNRKYYLIYNKVGSLVSYPNAVAIYDAKFGRWMDRPLNSAVGDQLGYPALLPKSANELYMASSVVAKVYEFESGTSDVGNNTQAIYKTKDFQSSDFSSISGGQFPVSNVRIKLSKITVTVFGTAGSVAILWTADRGRRSGSQTIDLTSQGDLVNINFIVNQSYVISSIADKTISKTLSNSAIGNLFNFQITHNGTGRQAEFKKLKIHALAYEED